MVLQVVEKDEAGTICRHYSVGPNQSELVVNLHTPSGDLRLAHNFRTLAEIFLPSGFPASVTPDYIRYQIFDSLQAFSSSIAGLLSSRAVLEGFGVGDENASATHAMLLTIVQDATSRLATILFAWRLGTALEPEAKMYRLAADVFNDSAIVLDCLSPALPSNIRIGALCLSGSLRALCGVAAGGAKAALSVHFSRAGNVGELNAKDSSQETVIGLLGMLCGSIVVSHITSRGATWVALLLLLAVHLTTNYLAVRAVVMTTLNRQRANIVYTVYRETGVILNPVQVSRRERVFEYDGALRDGPSDTFLGTCKIGASFDVVHRLLQRSSVPASTVLNDDVVRIFADQRYILWHAPRSGNSRRPRSFYIWSKDKATPTDHLKAWMHALELSRNYLIVGRNKQEATAPDLMRSTLDSLDRIFPTFLTQLKAAGWDTSVGALVTKPLRAVSIEHSDKSLMEKKLL